MSRLDDFEKLAELAREEPVPTPDVAAIVRQRLALRGPSRSDPLPWVVVAACATAAVVCGYFGLQAWGALGEPSLGSALSMTAWWLL
jgi:hypothetical protein